LSSALVTQRTRRGEGILVWVISFDMNGDALRHHRRLVRNMAPVAENELQRVVSLGQGDRGLGLAFAEMNMMFVGRDRFVERFALDLRSMMR